MSRGSVYLWSRTNFESRCQFCLSYFSHFCLDFIVSEYKNHKLWLLYVVPTNSYYCRCKIEVGYSLWSKCNTISITTYILRVDTEHFCCIFYLLLLVGIIVLFDIFVTQYPQQIARLSNRMNLCCRHTATLYTFYAVKSKPFGLQLKVVCFELHCI